MRAAIIVNNNSRDAVAIKHGWDEDDTLMEISFKGLNCNGAS
jgi:hypothetical protein